MLKRQDGFAKGRPEFKAEVQHLQRCLTLLGFELTADGYFGQATQEIVKTFQQNHRLKVTGDVDPGTWKIIESSLTGSAQAIDAPVGAKSSEKTATLSISDQQIKPLPLQNFKGDLIWILEREGHAGKAYWPGGASGITLDPGFDLGQQQQQDLEAQYADIISPQQLNACQLSLGIKGRAAKKYLNQSQALLSIRISKGQALQIFPAIIQPYWQAIGKRFPTLTKSTTPHCVQTALLSLAFNRGPYNTGLNVLAEPLEQSRWRDCAQQIANMQQDHELTGIRRRRQMEAELIIKGD